MIRQGFSIGDRDWYIMVYYNLLSDADYEEAEEAIIAAGKKPAYAQRVIQEIMWANTGYTLTMFGEHFTLILISHAESKEQLFDTINHEIKHAVEHISAYYHVEPKSEESAYLQGEISRNMYEAVSLLICP